MAYVLSANFSKGAPIVFKQWTCQRSTLRRRPFRLRENWFGQALCRIVHEPRHHFREANRGRPSRCRPQFAEIAPQRMRNLLQQATVSFDVPAPIKPKRILQLAEASDFVVASGEMHTVREFAEVAFGALGLDWRQHVKTDALLLNKISHPLCGDCGKLRAATGWSPSVTFVELVTRLVSEAEATLQLR